MSTPLVFKELQLRNFLSFGNSTTTIDLSNIGSTLIMGENVDANSNNGAGKTTIFNAICYVLYNKPFDNISLQRLINSTNDLKNTLMEVRLSFSKGEDEYEIYRCRGESNTINIMMNGVDMTLDSVNANDAALQEIMGMSYELFTKVVIFSGSSMPFLVMPVSQQRQQIEELFNITLLSEKAVKLKEIIKATEGNIDIQAAVIKEQEAQQALYERQLREAAARISRWEDDRVRQVELLTTQLERLSTVDMSAEKELHSVVGDLTSQISSLDSQKELVYRERVSLTSEVNKLQKELSHLVDAKCPYCLQQYEGADHKLIEKKELLESRQSKLVSIEEKERNIIDELAGLAAQLTEARSMLAFSSLTEAIKAENNAMTAQAKIDDLINAENPHVDAHEALKNNAVKKVSHTVLDELKREVEHQQFLLKLLTDKNSFVRRKIINRTIPFLNSRLIHYTKELGLPHIVKFDDDMSCTVSEYGRELDFGNLSSGEKKRVSMSLSLAFRDVLHHLHARVNCLFIDEIDASLDSSGVENVFRLIKQKTRDDGLGLWIISHRPEAVGRFDRSLIVRKENGFSRIIGEDMEEAA